MHTFYEIIRKNWKQSNHLLFTCWQETFSPTHRERESGGCYIRHYTLYSKIKEIKAKPVVNVYCLLKDANSSIFRMFISWNPHLQFLFSCPLSTIRRLKKSKVSLRVSSLVHRHWLKLCQNTSIAVCRGSVILLPKEFVKDKGDPYIIRYPICSNKDSKHVWEQTGICKASSKNCNFFIWKCQTATWTTGAAAD